jgi:uncharacterized membrane protein YqjE
VLRKPTGVIGDLSAIAATGVRAVRTRLELLGIELQEERQWLVRYVVVALGALLLLVFGLLLAVFALVLLASEAQRPAFLGIAGAAFLIAGALGAGWLQRRIRERPIPFSDTIAILRGDEAGLEPMPRGAGD